jgi:hypothetical protein
MDHSLLRRLRGAWRSPIPLVLHYTPLVPALALLSGKGIDAVARLAARRFRLPAGRVAVAAFLTILSLLATADWLLASRRTELDPRAMTYIQVAEWLRENTPDDASVALLEIGIVGFYSERTVVDTMGLVSPEMIGHLETWLQTLQFAVNYYWPDYVVALEGTSWTDIIHTAGRQFHGIRRANLSPRDHIWRPHALARL